MDFLALCQRLRTEAGYAGVGPVTVKNQTGDYARFVQWVVDANYEIQALQEEWSFLRAWTELTLPANEVRVALPTDFGHLPANNQAIAASAESESSFVPYRLVAYPDYLSHVLAAQESHRFCAIHEGHLFIHPQQAHARKIQLVYFRKPQILQENADVPLIPERYHLGIVYYALAMYAAYDEAGNAYQYASAKWMTYYNQMTKTELPQLVAAGPIA